MITSIPDGAAVRWCPSRKAAVLKAIQTGALTATEACRRYNLSEAELKTWEALLYLYGVRGLRTTRLQAYRR